MEGVGSTSSSELCHPGGRFEKYGLSTSRHGSHCGCHHRRTKRLGRIQVLLPSQSYPSGFPELAMTRNLTVQSLSHPQAYKPYSPRIPSDNQPLPLHNRPSTEQSQFRPSTNGASHRNEWASAGQIYGNSNGGQVHGHGNEDVNGNGHIYPPQGHGLLKQDIHGDEGMTGGRTGQETVQR